jgi:hypothetical protein
MMAGGARVLILKESAGGGYVHDATGQHFDTLDEAEHEAEMNGGLTLIRPSRAD